MRLNKCSYYCDQEFLFYFIYLNKLFYRISYTSVKKYLKIKVLEVWFFSFFLAVLKSKKNLNCLTTLITIQKGLTTAINTSCIFRKCWLNFITLIITHRKLSPNDSFSEQIVSFFSVQINFLYEWQPVKCLVTLFPR